jgi:hypothetical protein
MIRQHHHPRHHNAFTHYIPYIILAIAVIALVFLLVNMIIPEIPSIQTSPASSPVISPEQRIQQYWQFEASRWQAIADSNAKVTRPLTALEKYGYNLSGEAIPGSLKTSSGFRGDAIPYQAKPWLEPAIRPGFRGDAIPYQAKPWLQPGLITVDQHTYNLIAQYIPDFLPKVQQSISSGKLPAAQPDLISVDQHTYNLIAQYIPDLLSKVQLTDAEN